jgi:hypothetical protein
MRGRGRRCNVRRRERMAGEEEERGWNGGLTAVVVRSTRRQLANCLFENPVPGRKLMRGRGGNRSERER